MMSATAIWYRLLSVILIGILHEVRCASGAECSIRFRSEPIPIGDFYNKVLKTLYKDITDTHLEFYQDPGQTNIQMRNPTIITADGMEKNISTPDLATFNAIGGTMAIFTEDPYKYIFMVLCQSISLNDGCCNGSYMIYPAVAKEGPPSVDDLNGYMQDTFFLST